MKCFPLFFSLAAICVLNKARSSKTKTSENSEIQNLSKGIKLKKTNSLDVLVRIYGILV